MAERWSFTNPECLGFNLLLIWERFLSGKELPGCRLPALPRPPPPPCLSCSCRGASQPGCPKKQAAQGRGPQGGGRLGQCAPTSHIPHAQHLWGRAQACAWARARGRAASASKHAAVRMEMEIGDSGFSDLSH